MTARLATAVLALAAAGCLPTSTVAISPEASKPVPADRIYQRELTVPAPGRTAKLTFLRDAGALGSACTHRILVDEKLAFGIRSGEQQTLYVAPGRHALELQIAGGLCAGLLSTPVETELGDGAEQTYRILIPSLRGGPLLMKVGATPGPAVSPMVPGETTASPLLQRDILHYMLALDGDQDCKQRTLVKTEVVTPPTAANGFTAVERWTLDRCGTPTPYQIILTPSPRGGADFKVGPGS